MFLFNVLLLSFLIFCSIAVSMVKNLLAAVVIFAAYSLIMAIVWQQLNAPDLAITEAAVGAGVTTLLFVAAIKKISKGEKEK
ncbi:MAG: energy-converting hydrogenase subunit [Thermosediminibacterales bacterium]|nr:energy-converting hydrogenase subunit [Thermosediminibacterales bacterium]